MGQGRILVVDDEDNVRGVITAYLKGAHYDVIEAKDGVEAVRLAKQHHPAVVLMDVTMPEMDGLQACEKMKSDPDLIGMQIIICTARSGREDLMKAIRSGADDYIIKPFDRELVLTKVSRALSHHETPKPRLAPSGDRPSRAPRRTVRWSVTWHSPRCQSAFKCRVYDISVSGLAFEFPGCKVCSTEGGQLLPHWPSGTVIDLIIALNTDVLLEIQGTVARIEPVAGSRGLEKVGVRLHDLEPHAAALIQEYVDGKLEI